MPAVSYDWNQILASTLQNIKKKIVDNITKSHPFLDQLKRKKAIETYEGGTDTEDGKMTITIPVITSNTMNLKYLGGAYDKISVAANDGVSAATFVLAIVTNSIVIPWLHEIVNAGKFQLSKMLDTKRKQIQGEMGEEINKALIGESTETNKPASSLHELIYPYSSVTGTSYGTWNTLGRINSDTNSYWRNKVGAVSALSSVTIDAQMDRLWLQIQHEGVGLPTLLVCNDVAYNLYGDRVHAKIQIQQTGSIGKGDPSYDYLLYKGREMVPDGYMTNKDDTAKGIVKMINTEFTKYYIASKMNMKFTKFTGPWDGSDQLVRKSALLHAFCMGTENRRANGVLANIPTS